MSQHSVNIIRLGNIVPHPNANTLDTTTVNGFTCVIRRGDFQPGDLALYIEPDYVVPLDNPLFTFLRPENHPERKTQRIGVKRLRGIYSMGLLLPAPVDAQEGDDLMEALGITRYEPPEQTDASTGGTTEAPPYRQVIPTYDLENLRKWQAKAEGHQVIITEKVHGTNARYVWSSAYERMFCGSRREWKKEDATNLWWRALAQNPWIAEWCQKHPDVILWGEVYGWVQDLRYGAKPGEFFFRVFDIYTVDSATFWLPGMAQSIFGARAMPIVYQGIYPGFAAVEQMADADSALAKHIREGVVIEVTDVPNEWDTDLQAWRIKLKLPGNKYLSR